MEYFSERHGYKHVNAFETWEDLPSAAATRLWNHFYRSYSPHGDRNYSFLSKLWDKFFKRDVDKFSNGYGNPELCRWIKKILGESPWYVFYDFLEFIYWEDHGRNAGWELAINRILVEERIACRMVNGRIAPITNEAEIAELKEALDSHDAYKPARQHLEKALTILVDRKKEDFANSIKESISALESLAQILLGRKGTLGDLTKKLSIPPAFRDGLSKLYGWTSASGGIRHAKSAKDSEPTLPEARFMLILASAFFNYLISVCAPTEGTGNKL